MIDAKRYEHVKEEARRASALRSLAGREISPLPPVDNWTRRRKGAASLLEFCRLYFPEKFKKPFGKNHLALIDAFQRVISDGGKQAVAMPRGTGKTTIATVAAVWALFSARRRFVVIVAANTKEARKLLKSITTIVGTNPRLRADFPEICVPVAALKGSALLARGQLFYGEATNVQMGADSFRLPTIAGSPASGSVVASYGVKAAIRGLAAEGADGSTIRPDFLFLDDLQTDQIAVNPRRVADLEEIVASALEGLVENGAELAMVQTCTVKAPDDFADRALNRELNPRWNGLRFKSLEAMPERLDLWRQYRAIWFDDEKKATAFYRKNRKEMRKGAVVSWPEAYVGKKYLDALEFYMVKWCDNERAFWSEQQNQPLETNAGFVKLPAKEIAKRLNGFDEGVVPDDCAKITAAVDVHSDVLYFAVVAWSDDFTGRVIEYGTYPKQRRSYFAKNDGGLETLKSVYVGENADGRLFHGLADLLTILKGRKYYPEGNEDARGIDRILVDCGWKPEIVENAIRAVDPRLVVPCKGVAIGASRSPMRQWPRRVGRVFGWHLLDEKVANLSLRTLLVDVNYWKTRIHEAFGLSPGEPGSLSLFSRSRRDAFRQATNGSENTDASGSSQPSPATSSAGAHRMFSEHLAAETAKLVEHATNKVVEWSPNINRPDNHFFDALVYASAAASSLGLITPDSSVTR